MFTATELHHIATAARLALAAHATQLADDVLVGIASLTGKCGQHMAALEAAEKAKALAALDVVKADVAKSK